MAKKLIFIHGRDQKPDKESLQALWYDAIEHGLQRDCNGSGSLQAFKNVEKRFVYFGDLSNTLLFKPTEDPLSRQQALIKLKSYKTKQFNKKTYHDVSKAGFLQEALADMFSSVLNRLKAAEPIITLVAPDMAHYWYEDSYFGSDVRYRLMVELREALDNQDDVMIVSHSLGTMISYDVLWKLSHYSEYRGVYGAKKKVDLLVTLGSPLGDESVKDRLKGSRLKGFRKYPLNIHRWINISAEDDFISHDSKIKNDFEEMLKLGLVPGGMKDIYPIYNLNVRNRQSNPHGSIGYLINPKFIAVLDEWLST
ncbi:hypothetical protein QF117_14485 [Vibrio sp. YMD68]|uniref:hypothetical protein n=1 Tax=Vibrio sp. YMD68 TaxID=3042300 RepID=UPI00249BA5BE|nr:hypothetical protein [Vibrio sp. YMD68]WGV99153.1 hypothetical protein QF117_14485 [Vibrio sp. YMD68]